MGIAIITKGVSFASANLGQVTSAIVVPVESFDILGDASVVGLSATYTIGNYSPENTSQRDVAWSISSGGTYATINSSGVLTILEGAQSASVTIQATSTANAEVSASKTITVTYLDTSQGVTLSLTSNNHVIGIAGETTDSGCVLVSNSYNNSDATYGFYFNVSVAAYRFLQVTMPVTDSANDASCVYGLCFSRINNWTPTDTTRMKYVTMLESGTEKTTRTYLLDLVALRQEAMAAAGNSTDYFAYLFANVWSTSAQALYGECKIIGYE